MLVLSRKKNESIVINNDITVTVVEIRGDKVRLGIVAPKEVPVHRQEVYDAIHGAGKEAPEPAVTTPGPTSLTTGPVAPPGPTPLGAGGASPNSVPAPVVVSSK